MKTGTHCVIASAARQSLYILTITALVAVTVTGLFYGILAEADLQELKADRKTFNMVLCERALAQRAAEKDRATQGGAYEITK